MNEQQKRAFTAMLYIKEICENNGINYYLLAGSTLGAVRHGGFIPWDDDIDIGIKIDDINKLETLLVSLPEPYIYISQHTAKNYPRLSGKVLYEGRNCVDVFPLVKISDNSAVSRFQWYMHKVLMHLYFRKIGYEISVESKKIRAVSELLSHFVTRDGVVKMDDYILMLCDNKDVEYYCNITSKYSLEKEKIKATWLKNPQQVSFEGEMMSTVDKIDDYLRKLYGNYMELPPENERIPSHEEIFILNNFYDERI